MQNVFMDNKKKANDNLNATKQAADKSKALGQTSLTFTLKLMLNNCIG